MRYWIIVRGEVGRRLASTLGNVTVDTRHGNTAVVADVATPVQLETLLGRLGDLGLEIVSLGQEGHAIQHPGQR